MPCKVNGLNLKFIFDTGASDVSISMTEATFMLKNDYLKSDDIVGKSNYLDANGNINVGVNIILREIEIGGLKLTNVKASVVNNMKAPLLLGQSAISRLGTVQLDLKENTLTILNPKAALSEPVTAENNLTVDTTEAVEEVADAFAELYDQASGSFDEGNFQQTITNVDVILKEKPQHRDARFLRALSHDMLGDYKAAIADYSKVIQMDPKDYVAICYRGKSKYDLKDYAGALADLNRGLLLNGEYVSGLRWRAEAKQRMENYAGALQDFTKAISFSPEDSSLYVQRSVVKHVLKDYTGAVTDCNKAISLSNEYAYAFFRRALARRSLKQYSSAMEDLERTIELDPEFASAYVERGNIKEDLYEDLEGALEDYNKALEVDAEHVLATISKSVVEEKIKKNVWISVGSSAKGDKWYIYNSRVSKEYSRIKLWVKSELKSYTTRKNGRSVTYTNVHSLLLCLFDCSEREYKVLTTKYYNAKGELISEYEDGEYEASKAITPGTVMEAVFEKACERYNN